MPNTAKEYVEEIGIYINKENTIHCIDRPSHI